MKADQARLSASEQLIARCVVAFHFGVWSWGMWIALVIACFFHKISAVTLQACLVCEMSAVPALCSKAKY